ncbi:DgyrCDS1187 [Dimorphilus gyrociliatus]|uniref:DgyrCDS1187 n=1 Tax=Dimorphilus gyrociliatus TaxID=2664684 RepID=A0A7I8V6I0_9ANNE|nr:DgyrCDS1187 [Dimorphilus gyrociliatus]
MSLIRRITILSFPLAIGLYVMRDYNQGCQYAGKETLKGKNVIVTGANAGIGKETVADLASRGARVFMACRSAERAEAAKADILKDSHINPDQIIVMKLDLSSFKSIRSFVKEYKSNENYLHILVNNAGIMWTPFRKTEDGIESQAGVNHFGHFLLTNLLLDTLKKSSPARIVTVSSRAHSRATFDIENINNEKLYSVYRAYSNSKLMNVMFSRELGKRLKGTGVTTYSLHPGVIFTDLAKEVIPGGILRTIISYFITPFAKTVKSGAQTTIFCAVNNEVGSQTGLYYSDCAVKAPIPVAEDDEKSKQLWKFSEEVTGLNRE